MFSSHSLSDRFRSKTIFSFEILVSLRVIVGQLRRRLGNSLKISEFKVFKARIRKCRRGYFEPGLRIESLNLIKSDFEVKTQKFPGSRVVCEEKSSIKISWHEGVVEIPAASWRKLETKRNFSPFTGVWQIFQRIPCLLLQPSHDSCGNSSTFLIHPLLYCSSQANAVEDEKFFLIRIPLLSIVCDSFGGILIADSPGAWELHGINLKFPSISGLSRSSGGTRGHAWPC